MDMDKDMDLEREIEMEKDDDRNYYEKLDKDIEDVMKNGNSDRAMLGFERSDKELQMRVGEEKEMFERGGGLFFRGDKDFERDAVNEYSKTKM